jgi:hypothetical protein
MFLSFSLIILGSIGCSSASHIVGNWEDNTNKNAVEFTRDGNVVVNTNGYLISGKYQLIGNDIVNLKLEGVNGEIASALNGDTWQYTISGDNMMVQVGGQSLIYHRTSSINLTTTTTTSITTSSNPVIITKQPTVIVSSKISPATQSTTTTPTPPVITSVSKVSAAQTQTITINGHGFGNLDPYDGDSNYIQFSDITWGWDAGHKGGFLQTSNGVTLNITKWTDTQILVSGFIGKYGNFNLHVGDSVLIKVWNAPSGLGPSSFSLVCGALTNAASATPVITSVSKISTTQTQTITINGQGFGNLDPYNGDSSFIELTNVTSGWNAGYTGGSGQTPNGITLNITRWTETQITVSGFTGNYINGLNMGDNILIKVWNVPSGIGPVSYSCLIE